MGPRPAIVIAGRISPSAALEAASGGRPRGKFRVAFRLLGAVRPLRGAKQRPAVVASLLPYREDLISLYPFTLY